MELGIEPGLERRLKPGIELRMDPGLGLEPGKEPKMEPGIKPGTKPEPGIKPGMTPGLGAERGRHLVTGPRRPPAAPSPGSRGTPGCGWTGGPQGQPEPGQGTESLRRSLPLQGLLAALWFPRGQAG